MQHKYIDRCKFGASAMLPKIEKARQIRVSMAQEAQNDTPEVSEDIESECAELNEDYGDTVPSKPLSAPEASTSPEQDMWDDVELGDVWTRLMRKPLDSTFQC